MIITTMIIILLLGNSRTLMVAAISPAKSEAEEHYVASVSLVYI